MCPRSDARQSIAGGVLGTHHCGEEILSTWCSQAGSVKDHPVGQVRHIAKPVGLDVFPLVGKPPELVSLSNQLIVSLIFLFIPIDEVFTR